MQSVLWPEVTTPKKLSAESQTTEPMISTNPEYYARHTVTKAQAELRRINSTHEEENRLPGGL